MAKLVQAPSATDAMTAAEPLRRPGFVQTYTHKARDPLVKEQITQMVLNGAGVRDTARVLGVNRNTVSAQFKKNGAARAVVKSFM
jgi:transposase-like protein